MRSFAKFGIMQEFLLDSWITVYTSARRRFTPSRQVAIYSHKPTNKAEADEENISSGRERKLHTAQTSCFWKPSTISKFEVVCVVLLTSYAFCVRLCVSSGFPASDPLLKEPLLNGRPQVSCVAKATVASKNHTIHHLWLVRRVLQCHVLLWCFDTSFFLFKCVFGRFLSCWRPRNAPKTRFNMRPSV